MDNKIENIIGNFTKKILEIDLIDKSFDDKLKYIDLLVNNLIDYCIKNSNKLRDKYWEDAWNAISRVPPSGRILKVVYKPKGKTIKILTAYWLD